MGLRDKVALVFLTGVITQITIGYCMPSSSRKTCMRRYLDSFKQAKTNPVSKSPYPTKGIKTTKNIFSKCKNAKASKEALTDKSIYTAYNFPETEYPLDSFPRDRFYLGTDFNNNPFEISKKELCDPQSETFNNLRKEMRMKRKLNRLNNNEIYQTMTKIPSYTAFSMLPVCLKDQATFPEVQYPTNAMETWIPHYWKSTFCNPYETKYTEFPTYDTKLCENTTIFYKPYKQQFRSKTKQFMEQIEKLKAKMRGTPQSEPIKETRELNASNGGGSISEGLIKPDSNTTNVTPVGMEPTVNKETEAIATITDEDKYLTNKSTSTNTNKCESEGTYTQTDTTTITSRKDCIKPVTTLIESENLSVPTVPLPYKGFEQYDMCSAFNSKDSNDGEGSVSDKTVKSPNLSDCLNKRNISPPINTKPIVDEYNSPSNCSTSDTNTLLKVIETSSASSLNEMHSEGMISPPVNVTDNTANGPCSDYVMLLPIKDNPEPSSNASGPLNIKLPIPLDSTINSSMPDCKPIEYVKQMPVNNVPYRSLFIVPVGSSISEIQLPIMEGNSGAPIIVIVPTTEKTEKSTMSSTDTHNLASCSFITASNNTFDKESKIPTKYEFQQTTSMVSDKFFNKEPRAIEYIPEIPSADTDYWESLLPDFEMLPNNSMCYATTETVKYKNFTDTRPDKEQGETTPTDAVKDDTTVSTNQRIPSLPDDSTDVPNKKQAGTAPVDSTNNDTREPKDTNLLETLQGPNKGQDEPAPTDTAQSDPPVSKDTNIPETSLPDDFTDFEPGKVQGNPTPDLTVQNDIPEDTTLPETSLPDNCIDSGPDKGLAAEPAPLDAVQDEKPVSKDTNVSETSPSYNSTDIIGKTPTDIVQNETPVLKDTNLLETALPHNSLDSRSDKGLAEPDPIGTTQNDTPVFKDTNESESLQPNSSAGTGPNKGPTECAPLDTNQNDTPVSKDTNVPEILQPNSSADTGPNKGPTECAPFDTNQNDTPVSKDTNVPETSPTDSSADTGPNKEPTESALLDTSQNDTPVSKDANLPETSQPDNSTDVGLDKGTTAEPAPLDTVQDDKPVFKDTNVSETSPTDSSADTGPNKEPTESAPRDTGQTDTPVSKDANVPETLQPDNSTDSGPDKGPAVELPPLDAIQDEKPVSKDTNVSETSPDNSTDIIGKTLTDIFQNETPVLKDTNLLETALPNNSLDSRSDKGLAEPDPIRTTQNDTPVFNDTNESESLQPNSSAGTGPNKGPTECAPLDTNQNDTPVSKDTNVPEILQPNSSADTGPNKGPTECAPFDTNQNDTPVSKDTNVPETSPTDSSADTGPNKEPTESALLDTSQNDTPVSKDANLPETSQPDNSTDVGLDKGTTAEPAPLDTVQDDKPVFKDTNVSETSPTDSSADTGPNKEPTESAPRDTGQTDTPVSKDANVPETLQPDNSTDSGPDKGPAVEPPPLDAIQDEKPVSKDTNVSETSPDNSTDIIGKTLTDIFQNETPVLKDTNLLETALPNNSLDSRSYKGLAEPDPIGSTQNDTPVFNDTNVPETLQPNSSADTGPNEGPTECALLDTNQNDTPVSKDTNVPETLQPNSSADTGPNKEPTKRAPLDTNQNDTPVTKDTNVPETSPTDSSADTGPNKEPTESALLDTSQNDTPISKDANLPETSQPDNSTDVGPDKGPAAKPAPTESAPRDTSQNDKPASKDTNDQNDTPVSKDTNVPETAQPDSSADTKPNKGPTESAPLDTIENNKPVSKDANVPETLLAANPLGTGPDKELAELTPLDTVQNDTTVSKNKNIPESSLPDSPSDSEPDKGLAEPAPLDTIPNDTPVSNKDPKVSETSIPDSFPDSVPMKGLIGTTATDTITNYTPVLKDTNLPENLQPDSFPDSGPDKGLAQSTPLDSTQTETPILKNTILPQSILPFNSADFVLDKEIAQSTPTDTGTNNTPVLKDLNLPENSVSDISTDPRPNKRQAATTSNDIVDTCVHKDTNVPKTSLRGNAKHEPNKGETETVLIDSIKNETSVTKDTNLSENSLPENSKNASSIEQVDSECSAIKNITTLLKDVGPPDTLLNKESTVYELIKSSTEKSSADSLKNNTSSPKDLSDAIKGLVLNIIKNYTLLPVDSKQPLSKLIDKNVGFELEKELSNAKVPEIVKDDQLRLTLLSNNIDHLELDKGIPDDIIKNDKILPKGMELPLSLLTDKLKISELDKRLAKNEPTNTLENDRILLKEMAVPEMPNDNVKSCAINKGSTNTAQNDVIINTKKIPETSLADDAIKVKIEKGPSKKIKSKFSYKYRSHSNMYERQKPADAIDPNIIKDDNPLRVNIDLPLSLQPKNTLPDTTITRNSKTNIEVPDVFGTSIFVSTDNIENSKQDKAVPDLLLSNVAKDKMLLPIDEMPIFTARGYANYILHDKAMKDNPTAGKDASHNGFTPVIKEAPISIAKELTRAELKELIKYLYISV